MTVGLLYSSISRAKNGIAVLAVVIDENLSLKSHIAPKINKDSSTMSVKCDPLHVHIHAGGKFPLALSK